MHSSPLSLISDSSGSQHRNTSPVSVYKYFNGLSMVFFCLVPPTGLEPALTAFGERCLSFRLQRRYVECRVGLAPTTLRICNPLHLLLCHRHREWWVGVGRWSGQRESNSRVNLGKVSGYHYIMAANHRMHFFAYRILLACCMHSLELGAGCRVRTDDLSLTRRLLYQLS